MKQIGITISTLLVLLGSLFGQAQQTVVATNTSVTVPPLVNFSGTLTDLNGKPLSGTVGVTFLLYKESQGGSPLWLETQNVQPDNTGHYTVMLGSTSSTGLPSDIFVAGEAHWLGVQVQGQQQEEQPRVLLVSAPYALKAGDAETIGGLPPSAFVLASPGMASSSSTPTAFVASAAPADAPAGTDVTGSGTADFIPLWTSTSNIADSVLFQSGSGSTAKVGVNTTTPASTLDVKGGGTIRGTLSLPTLGAATATAGKNSQPLTLAASAFSSTTSTAVNQVFQWQAEAADNDTTAPSGTLNLLFGEGATKPSETGLNISSNGQITFATGQTFPGTGTGDGTITGVTAGTDLTGGGATGSVTLNLDTTKVPQLSAANTFTGNQTVSGNLTATGVVSGSSFEIGSNLFAFGSYTNANALLGFAGNSTMTGVQNTASGAYALYMNATGISNTANGFEALYLNSTGSDNTAYGASALLSNTGSDNTANGYGALYQNTTGINNTATGVYALYFNTTASDNTAIGLEALEYNATGANNTASGFEALGENTTGSGNTADGYEALLNSTSCCNVAVGDLALQYVTSGQANTGVGNNAGATVDGSKVTGNNNTTLGTGTKLATGTLTNATALGANAEVDASNSLVLGSINGVNGQTVTAKVGIGTTTPSNVFTIASGAGKAIADGWSTYSSRRWKTNIHPLYNALGKVEQLRGVSYDLKNSGKHEIGVIAEEVGTVVPEVVTYEENGKDARGVDYSRLTAVLIEAVKQQQREFRQQQTELSKALSQIRSLKVEVRQTREALRKVKAQVTATQLAAVAAE